MDSPLLSSINCVLIPKSRQIALLLRSKIAFQDVFCEESAGLASITSLQ